MKKAREVNNQKTDFVVEKILSACESIEKPIVACYGLTYKANVDDFRESPALRIARALHEKIEVLAVEPFDDGSLGPLKIVDQAEAEAKANVVAILVGHEQFRSLNLKGSQTLLDFIGFFQA